MALHNITEITSRPSAELLTLPNPDFWFLRKDIQNFRPDLARLLLNYCPPML